MAQLDKAIERLRRRPAEARVEDVLVVLAAHGWYAKEPGARHLVFKKPGHRTLTVPQVNRRVKRVYLAEILSLLGLDTEAKD